MVENLYLFPRENNIDDLQIPYMTSTKLFMATKSECNLIRVKQCVVILTHS